jgi:hypothetical protein
VKEKDKGRKKPRKGMGRGEGEEMAAGRWAEKVEGWASGIAGLGWPVKKRSRVRGLEF